MTGCSRLLILTKIKTNLFAYQLTIYIFAGMEEKLTYRQICMFAAAGQYGLIPDGYKVRWANGIAPGRVSDMELSGGCVTITRNSFPQPDRIRISGERVVAVPVTVHDVLEEPMEFGEVFIPVRFTFTNIEFIYYNKDAAEAAEKRVNEYSDVIATRGFIERKKDFAINVDVEIDYGILSIHNLMFSKIEYPSLSYSEDNPEQLVVEFNFCDWWNFVNNIK